MAEALLRRELADQVSIQSAGVEPWKHLHPMAIKVMNEMGISLGGHYPKGTDVMRDKSFDVVVTIGEPARLKTPDKLKEGRWIHWNISDPADADGTPDSFAVFKKAELEIEKQLKELVKLIAGLKK